IIGLPHRPNPPTAIDAPSAMSATASSGSRTTLSIPALSVVLITTPSCAPSATTTRTPILLSGHPARSGSPTPGGFAREWLYRTTRARTRAAAPLRRRCGTAKELTMTDSTDVVIIGAARTPFARLNGAPSTLPATTLGAHAIAAALAQSGLDGEEVDAVYLGQVLQAGA